MGSKLKLNQSLPDIAVNPETGAALSSDGQPTATFDLKPNYNIGIIGFKVPQGAAYIVSPNPWVKMKLYTDSGGTTEIAAGDTISLWAKAPSDPKTSLGEFVASDQYRGWENLDLNQQRIGQFSSSLLFPIEQEFSLLENFTLIVAVATLISSETVDWTASYIEIPVEQITSY